MSDLENMTSLERKLFTQFADGTLYPENEKLQGHLIDQYKLYVEMADRVSSRRQLANSYFVTLNTVLLAFIEYVTNGFEGTYVWMIGIAGIITCYSWSRLIRSFRDMNTAKFAVIHAIETKLPLRPYDAEWDALGRGTNPALYKPFTTIERVIPWIFMSLHAYVFLAAFPWASLILFLKECVGL